jgi:hypothetical protein
LGIGIAESIPEVEESESLKLHISNKSRWFISFINKDVQDKIWETTDENREFAASFAYEIGKRIEYFESEDALLTKLFEIAEKNGEFAYNLGKGVSFPGYHGISFGFSHLDKKKVLQLKLLEIAKKNGEFARGLATNIKLNFDANDKEVQDKIWEIAYKNKEFANIWFKSIDEWNIWRTIFAKTKFQLKLRKNSKLFLSAFERH